MVRTIGVGGAGWQAVPRVGLGSWRLERRRCEGKKGRSGRGSGIARAADVAGVRRRGFVQDGFETVVPPRPRAVAVAVAYVVMYAQLAVGLGVVAGLLTPGVLVGGLMLNLLYLVLRIHDWAEREQNSMMALISVVSPFGVSWRSWSPAGVRGWSR